MAKNFITILSLLVTIIVSITAYAYNSNIEEIKSDIDAVELKIIKECSDREKSDNQLSIDIEDSMTNHEKLHAADEKRSELLMEYLDNRFDNMEKLINKGS